ncbi:sigma-70 family RNA polymerase sigma factor [Saccharothrix sp. S26]|uniref:RNA polymerase sigma factor n=1 Tax=Saccharothrix sp. S26 TaxID=2907215 RepID=UPI001F16A7F1|nr:sigma-70 family RNA polymerase sigma factor [Saccharothrix sp. S26]MCE6998446.1 sigma-70 family RNA polymerase sigma factor [Saccharothrix sp. S26]
MKHDPVSEVDRRTRRPHVLAEHLERARAGDLAALDDVVAQLNPLLWHVARAQGLTREDAADVVQTTWLELVRQLDTIRSPLALTAWLVSATRREAWRTNARRRRHVQVGDDVLAGLPDGEPDPGERLGADERHRALWRHFTRLAERCQALLRVIAVADRPDYASISEALGMPPGSIGPTRGRCLAKLRAMLLADPAWSAE